MIINGIWVIPLQKGVKKEVVSLTYKIKDTGY